MRWELDRIRRALAGIDSKVVLLKGAAYLLAELAVARGRLSTDVDILAPGRQLGAIEAKLLEHGWRHVKIEQYDQFFYRKWSHELPPLVHRERKTIVDVHHTILPPFGRIRPDAEKLLAAAMPVSGTGFHMLTPTDMVLHSAAHAFQDGDLTRGLRDLVDLDALLDQFSDSDPDFWERLACRAEELGLIRPLYYGVRYSRKYLQTQVPERFLDRMERWRPSGFALTVMDAVVERVLIATPWPRKIDASVSRKFLYIRAHWLRMPPYLLLPHLTRKLFRKGQAGGNQ